MDIDYLIEKINQERVNDLRVTSNSGREIDVPPGARAFVDATDTIHVIWPAIDPANPFRVARTITLAAVNVASLEHVNQKAG